MGRGPGNFGLQLAGFASRLGLSRCEDGNSGTQKTKLENETNVETGGSWGMGHKMGRADKNGTNAL